MEFLDLFPPRTTIPVTYVIPPTRLMPRVRLMQSGRLIALMTDGLTWSGSYSSMQTGGLHSSKPSLSSRRLKKTTLSST